MREDKPKTLKLIVEFDGTGFYGWQRQPGRRTVQGVLEEAVQQITGCRSTVVGSGRTDRGVHAVGMTAHIKLLTHLEPDQMVKALNGLLPWDVTVRSISLEKNDFHARYGATGRWYRYRMITRPSSLSHHRAWWVKYQLNGDVMSEAASYLLGAHDVRGFCAHNPDVKDYHTVVTRCEINKVDGWIEEWILDMEAVRFFHRMVRIITGTLVDVGRGFCNPDVVRDILAQGDSSLAGPAAPAWGLYLMAVKYD